MATNAEVKAFIQLLGGLAVAECNRRIQAGKGFPLPSVCIAQSALETGWGTAGLMTRANAFFGIKAGGSWTGKIYTGDTWEVVDGERYNTVANFRAYDSLEHSVADYFDLIGNNTRYANSLSYGADKSQWKTPYECIHAIWSGGYATDDVYVPQIMNMINGRNLTEYDKLVTGEGTPPLDYSTGGGGTGSPIINNAPVQVTKVIKGSSLIQGALAVTDSGRSIQTVSALGSVTMEWSKAITIAPNSRGYMRGLGNDYKAFFVSLTGDIASVTGPHDDNTLITNTSADSIKFAIYLERADTGNVTPADVKNLEIILEFDTMPDGAEINKYGIAHFVKI